MARWERDKHHDTEADYKRYAETSVAPPPFVPNWKRNGFESAQHATLTAIKQCADKLGGKKKPLDYIPQFGDLVFTYKGVRFVF